MLLDQILYRVPCPIFWKGLDGAFLGCNRLFLSVGGFHDYSQLIGKTDAELPWKQYKDEYYKDDQYVITTGKTITRVENIPLQNHIIISETTKAPLIQDGKIIGVLGICLDVTDHRKRVELEKQQAILDEKIKVLQLMGGAVAHELRTPLAAIKLAAQAVERLLPKLFEAYHLAVDNKLMKPVTNEAHFKIIETVFQNIQEEVNASNVFIDNMLLNIQQLAADPKDMEALSMKKCVEDALQRFPFDEKSRAFTTADVDYDFMFKGMPVLMQHVIFNLLRNGIYYVLEATKDEAGIKIWTTPGKDGWHELHFKDTGTGISEEHMKHVFERFFSKRYHGTGVGLAFCKQVITQFGGTIACESKEREYTHFIMSFPPVDEKKELIQG